MFRRVLFFRSVRLPAGTPVVRPPAGMPVASSVPQAVFLPRRGEYAVVVPTTARGGTPPLGGASHCSGCATLRRSVACCCLNTAWDFVALGARRPPFVRCCHRIPRPFPPPVVVLPPAARTPKIPVRRAHASGQLQCFVPRSPRHAPGGLRCRHLHRVVTRHIRGCDRYARQQLRPIRLLRSFRRPCPGVSGCCFGVPVASSKSG